MTHSNSGRIAPITESGQIAKDQVPDSDTPTLVLTTVAAPYGDRLTTYDAAGSGIIWRVPDDLSSRVAAGTLPRREAGEQVSTQCVVVDQERGVLRALENQEWPVTMLDDSAERVSSDEYRERTRQMLVAAARRGESVILARPGQMQMEPPCVRSSVIRDSDGEWTSVIEAFPAVSDGAWADAEQEQGLSRKSAHVGVDAGDAEDTLIGGAILMLLAARTFTKGPEQVGLFFEPSPDGPWPGPEPTG